VRRIGATLFLTGVLAGMLTFPRRAGAQPEPPADAFEEPAFAPRLGATHRAGLALQAYTGVAAYRTSSATWGHGVLGGTLRLRYGCVELGGYYEASDRIEQGSWTAAGGFAGAYLPYENWVDFEIVAGLASRTHREEDARYGPNGYAWSTPALIWRVSVSDRSSDTTAALRVGVELYGAFDLRRREQPWQLVYQRPAGIPPLVFSGVTDVGGFSAGLLFSIGFDIAIQPLARARSGAGQG
jgi:hypothetical protein